MRLFVLLMSCLLAASFASAATYEPVVINRPIDSFVEVSYTPHSTHYRAFHDYGSYKTYTQGYRTYSGGCIGSGCGYNALHRHSSCAASYCQRTRYNEVYNRINGNYPHPRFTY